MEMAAIVYTISRKDWPSVHANHMIPIEEERVDYHLPIFNSLLIKQITQYLKNKRVMTRHNSIAKAHNIIVYSNLSQCFVSKMHYI